LREASLEPDFIITCRQTSTPGEWGVWVTHEPRDMATSKSPNGRGRRKAG
jgi:hypothetical protein